MFSTAHWKWLIKISRISFTQICDIHHHLTNYSGTGVWSVVVSFNSAQTNWPFMSAVTSNHHTMTAPLRGGGTSALIVHTPSLPAGPSAVCTFGRCTRWTRACMHAPPAPTRRCPGQALLLWTPFLSKTFSLPHASTNVQCQAGVWVSFLNGGYGRNNRAFVFEGEP